LITLLKRPSINGMEQSKDSDKLFNDLTNQDQGHSKRPRRTRRSKENVDGGTTGRVTDSKGKFMTVAASPDAFLASGRSGRKQRKNQLQVGGGGGNLGGAKFEEIGLLGGEGDNAPQQQGEGGGDLQVKDEDGEEVALVGEVVVEEENDDHHDHILIAYGELKELQRKRSRMAKIVEGAQRRLQIVAEKENAQRAKIDRLLMASPLLKKP